MLALLRIIRTATPITVVVAKPRVATCIAPTVAPTRNRVGNRFITMTLA
jgi:hypothetical protein